MHLDDERTERFVHGELSAEEKPGVREHLSACSGCRHAVERARREDEEVLELLGLLDHPLPTLRIEDVLRRGRSGPRAFARWAAGIILALAVATAAYAAPGSPLPGWVDRLIEGFDGASSPPATRSTSESLREQGASGGIAVPPGERLAIIIRGIRGSGMLTVQMEGREEVVFEARGSVPAFTTDEGRLLVDNAGPDVDFLVRIPPQAPRVEIFVGGVTVFLKTGSAIAAIVEPDTTGAYRIPLAGAR